MKNNYQTIYLKLTRPISLPYIWQDLILAIPRIIAGFLLTTQFGSAKFGLPWSPEDNNLGFFEVAFWFPNDVASYGGVFALFPAVLAWLAAFSEAVGGLMLILGFQTRLMSCLLVCTMLVAIFMQKWGSGIWQILPAMSFLWVTMFTLILGAGKFSIDHLISKNK